MIKTIYINLKSKISIFNYFLFKVKWTHLILNSHHKD